MARKKTKAVFMRIDEQLYIRSRPLIVNRTEDYEDYLRRRIAGDNRADVIKMEIDLLDLRRNQLMKEYDIEVGLQEEQSLQGLTEDEHLMMAVQTVKRVVEREGVIGLDKLEDIANLQDVNYYELKEALPDAILEQLVKHHPVVRHTESEGGFLL